MSSLGDIGELLLSFPNHTKAMWNGDEPVGTGGKYLTTDGKEILSDRWQMKYGGGESLGDDLKYGSFSLGHKITIYITYQNLNIVDIRYAGKPDTWEYSNGGLYLSREGKLDKSFHELEPDRLRKILNHKKLEESKFGRMVRAKAFELLDQTAKKEWRI